MRILVAKAEQSGGLIPEAPSTIGNIQVPKLVAQVAVVDANRILISLPFLLLLL